ncbi:MAG: LSM domain-containing protein [Nitrosopumilaceae archaeon]|nr:LSM domain-containing protein [Nitrosopumilaceae archaeon]
MATDIDRFLEKSVNKTILIKLKDNRTIKGDLNSFDEQMNLVLKNAVEVGTDNKNTPLDDILLRGNVIVAVSLFDETK